MEFAEDAGPAEASIEVSNLVWGKATEEEVGGDGGDDANDDEEPFGGAQDGEPGGSPEAPEVPPSIAAAGASGGSSSSSSGGSSSGSSSSSSKRSSGHHRGSISSLSSSSAAPAASGHRAHSRASAKPNCYARLVGKRRQLAPPLPEDPGTSSSVFGWARDRVLGMVAGESADERKTRLRLNWYKTVLQAELTVVEKARLHFGQHGRDLAVEFEMQELQLQKWGLLNILPAFRMQAWARVSRSALLGDIAVVADKILRLRLQRSQDVIALYASDSRGSRKHPLGSYSAFCLEPDLVMAKEPALAQLGHRLARMDKVCNASLHVFKTMLPELESRTFAQRKHMLGDVLNRYSALVAMTEPAALEASMTWPDFCAWYALRHQDMAELEREYGNFVEDEREREGRLFRRWCTLTLLADEGGKEDEAVSAVRSQGAVKSTKMSPRSIIAFVRHFAVNVIAAKYNTPLGKHEVLVALTESLVYRRINSCVLRYPAQAMQEKDVAWRKKCSACRLVNPVSYGVPQEYAFGPGGGSSDTSVGSGSAAGAHLRSTSGSGKEGVSRCSSSSSKEGVAGKDETAASRDEDSGGSDRKSEHSSERKSGAASDDGKWEGGGRERANSTSTIDYNLRSMASSSREDGDDSLPADDALPSSGLARRRSRRGSSKGEEELFVKKLSLAARLEALPEAPPGTFGRPYAHASRILSLLASSITPREVTHNLLLALKWLLKDAVQLSGRRDYLGADLMFPILVLVLVNAQIPTMHLVLHFLHKFGEYDVQGEAAYYVTCLEAAVAFVLRMEAPSEPDASADAAHDESLLDPDASRDLSVDAGDDSPGRGADRADPSGETDMEKLSAWLRDQQTMEETIEILQAEGWMV